MTVADLLRREVAGDAARPLLTWYDDATGARVELSVATTANWAAKIANLLVDDYDAEPGSTVGVRLPTHWQTAVVLLGIWCVGGCAVVGGDGEPTFGGDVALTPDAMGADLSRLVAAQPDLFVPPVAVDASAPALTVAGRTWSHEELAAASEQAARHHGVDAASRVLSTLPYDTVDGLDAGLLVPLAAGGSVVLVTDADGSRLAERCATEKVTHTAGVAVDGIPRLD